MNWRRQKKAASDWRRQCSENWKSTVVIIGLSIAAAAYAFFKLHFSFLTLAVFPAAVVLAIFVTVPLLRRLKNDVLVAFYNKKHSGIDKSITALIVLSVIAVATLSVVMMPVWLPVKLPIVAIVAISMVAPALFYAVVREIFPRGTYLKKSELAYSPESNEEYNPITGSFSESYYRSHGTFPRRRAMGEGGETSGYGLKVGRDDRKQFGSQQPSGFRFDQGYGSFRDEEVESDSDTPTCWPFSNSRSSRSSS